MRDWGRETGEPEAIAARRAAAPPARAPALLSAPAQALGARPESVMAMQRGAGNALTARMLARRRMTSSELRAVNAPPALAALLDRLHAATGRAARQSVALEIVDACDEALAGGVEGEAASKVRALRRQALEAGAEDYAATGAAGIPTFDTTDKAEGWTTADAPGSAPRAGDNRRFPVAEARGWRQQGVFAALAGVRTLDDVDALEPGVVRDINPQGLIPYRILRDVLHESWHVAKELLLDPAAPNGNRRALMTKLWEYRQWHHQEILAEVMEELNRRQADPEALKPSKGAGSATLSSDIDVNLKGAHTELAVPLFNQRFKRSQRLPEHQFTNEPGVVYDVNVYAIDFMHSFLPNEDKATGRRTTQKEGAREGRQEGGLGSDTLREADRERQLVTALFKVRLFMDKEQWAAYRTQTMRGLVGDALGVQQALFEVAEQRFAGYLDEMAQQMGVRLGDVADAATSGVEQLKRGAASVVPGESHDHGVAARRENVLMDAANRIYEARLADIHARRAGLKALIAALKAAEPDDRPPIEQAIDWNLYELRQKVAEAAMFANEASMTDATIHHGVVGIQGGMQIDQQKAEGVNALNEHLADVMKEAGRYGDDRGQAAYKAGKYLMRLGDAAKNLGYGYIWGVQVLYDLGRKLSEDIKVRADKGNVDTSAESWAAVEAITGCKALPDLLALVSRTAAEVMQEYTHERSAHLEYHRDDPATAYGHRTGPKKSENVHVLNQDMVHPASAQQGGLVELQRSPGDFAFRLTDAELQALKEKWAKAAPDTARS